MVEHLTFNQGVEGSSPSWLTMIVLCARVAELADALDLGSSVFDVGVQVPPRAPDLCGSGSAVEHRLAKARVAGSIPVFRSIISYVPLAQLDRAFDYESKGREFESLRARHYYFRDVAQLGRAPGLGPGGRMFKSCRPDTSVPVAQLDRATAF